MAAGSCDLPEGPAYGKGTITLILPKTRGQEAAAYNKAAVVSRSVLPDGFIGTLAYRLTLTGPGETQTLEAGGGGIAVSLDAGEWAIQAEAYDPAAPAVTVGTGSAVMTVIAGQNTSVRIPMKIDPAYEAGLTEIYIHTEEDLRRVGTDFAIDGTISFYLEQNIVLTRPWSPIGDDTAPFKAKFDGNGKKVTINSFTSASLSGEYIGLFAYTDGAEIKNLMVDCNLGTSGSPLALTGTGWIHAGVLTGYADNGSLIENVSVSGSLYVSAALNFGLYFGGIAGGNSNSSVIRSSHVRADLHASTEDLNVYIGGLAGENKSAGGSGGIIEKSSFAGTVFIRDDESLSPPLTATNVYAGGIVGDMYSGSISACWASGTIDVWSYNGTVYAGGIAGGSSHIERCYAWTSILAEADTNGTGSAYAGGIGGIIHTGTFSQCYALGDVTTRKLGAADCYSGGIAGNSYQGTIEYCAALNDVTAGSSGYGYAIAGQQQLGCTFTGNYAANDKTASPSNPPDPDLKGYNTFASTAFRGPTAGAAYDSTNLNWSFPNNWKFLSGYPYPVLPWQTSPPVDPATL
ncbi:MAG: hypothetical protein LBH26_04215 [Treponema sp.]|nr:hypothetical protein [Treponema sp.]